MALGAEARDILRLFLRQAGTVVAAGMVVGLLVAAAATRLLSSLLFGVSAADMGTWLGACALLLMTALAAAYIPARRAASVDPMQSLRYE